MFVLVGFVAMGKLKTALKLLNMKETLLKLMRGMLLEKNKIFGPFLFVDRVINGDSYLDMLQNHFNPQLEQLQLKDDTVIQQYRAFCHFALLVRQFLNQEFPNRWIGRGEPFSSWES